MNFKEAIRRDSAKVFHNRAEFAEQMMVKYDGEWYSIPVVLDHSGEKDRKRHTTTDHAQGIFVCDVTAYINEADLPKKPRKDRNIEIEGDLYNIAKVEVEMGEIVLYLEMLDE